MLRPAILFMAVITSIGYLQVFEEPFVMTGGGPLDSTLSVSMFVYQQGFRFFNLGYASAVAYTLFVAIVVLAIDPVPVPAEDEDMSMTRARPAASRAPLRRRPRGAAPAQAARRPRAPWWLYVAARARHGLVMVGPFLWMLLGAFKTQRELLAGAADAAAREPDAGQLRRGSSPGSTSPATSGTRR